MAVALFVLAIASAAEKSPSLIGATREQVLARYGEPKSQIAAGNREVLFFARERVVLRDGRVVEVETFAEEPAPRRAPPPSPAPELSAPPEERMVDRTGENPPPPEPVAPANDALDQDAPFAPPPEPKLEIKSVLRPGAAGTRADSRTQTADSSASPAAPAATTPRAPAPPTTAPTISAATPSPTPAPRAPAAPSSVQSSVATETPAPAESAEPTATTTADLAANAEEPAAESVAPVAEEKSAAPKQGAQTAPDSGYVDPTEAIFTGRTYLIAFVIIVGGLGYLYWRHRQRQLLLAATVVSRAPFSSPPPTGGGAVFTADLLSKLEWKRFEELVASYYSKTGVVASRTKSGPSGAVNIKISWKGEPRPFACVRCIAQPSGLIDAKPLQELFAVLTAEDIRRGYVVTPGKFNVTARDFAEEKHITLLPGDIFLEKLNALPDAARSELMHETTRGDYTTPSCPTCEGKMMRSPEDPAMWRCPIHEDQQIRGRK